MPGNTNTVEDLIRYAAREFEACGLVYPPARMKKLIRREMRAHGAERTKAVVDRYLDRELVSWANFELYVDPKAGRYADPTGAHAVNNIMNERRRDRQREEAA